MEEKDVMTTNVITVPPDAKVEEIADLLLTNHISVIPGDIGTSDLVMSHTSVNFDRTGFQQDLNVVFALDRLNELADEGVIGSVAGFHYSFMGATDPREMEPTARHLAGLLKEDAVNAVLMVPV